jgi:hypothetical protein
MYRSVPPSKRLILYIKQSCETFRTPSAPFKVHSLHGGGFLQVAVSEAPVGYSDCALMRGALQIQHYDFTGLIFWRPWGSAEVSIGPHE